MYIGVFGDCMLWVWLHAHQWLALRVPKDEAHANVPCNAFAFAMLDACAELPHQTTDATSRQPCTLTTLRSDLRGLVGRARQLGPAGPNNLTRVSSATWAWPLPMPTSVERSAMRCASS